MAAYTRYPRTLLWLIRGGEFTVGGEEADSKPRFTVELPSFYISKFPITNVQFEAFDSGFVRSENSPDDSDPAVGISWEEAQDYAEWYASVARKPIRLPTEVEWEYACRAGAAGPCSFEGEDPDDYVWHSGNSPGRVPPLKEKRPNEFGLYGMLGGVWEWTGSDFLPYPLADVVEQKEGGFKVQRGGSYRTRLAEISCSRRKAVAPDTRSPDTGFRLVREFDIRPGRP